jgi:hypothetical protein
MVDLASKPILVNVAKGLKVRLQNSRGQADRGGAKLNIFLRRPKIGHYFIFLSYFTVV